MKVIVWLSNSPSYIMFSNHWKTIQLQVLKLRCRFSAYAHDLEWSFMISLFSLWLSKIAQWWNNKSILHKVGSYRLLTSLVFENTKPEIKLFVLKLFVFVENRYRFRFLISRPTCDKNFNFVGDIIHRKVSQLFFYSA